MRAEAATADDRRELPRIETGARGQARVDSAVAEKLGIAPAGERPASDGANRGAQRSTVLGDVANIGAKALADFTITSDQANSRVSFVRSTSAPQ